MQLKKLANVLNTTVGYLLGETADRDLLKNPAMLKRLNEIGKMDKEDKTHTLHVLDGFIKSVRLKNIAILELPLSISLIILSYFDL